jgi:RHS repeat-associated protein
MVDGVTETLSYDALNQLVESSASNGGQEYYVYDASGERVLKRSTSAGTTTLTAYPFGLQERTSSGGGRYQNQIDYDSIAGHLIGWSSGTSTTYDLTDALGSVVLSFSAGGIQGEQLYGPYGNQRYLEGSLGTDKGYNTGQFADSVTGLDYDHARWYDPVSGRFVSPDGVQGNAQGMDPYAYVEGNPETRTDPTGQKPVGCMPNDPGCSPWGTPTNCGKDQNQPCGNEPTHPTGGVPDPGPGSGGCEKGWHLTNSGCAQNGSDCLVGMHAGKGGCVYDSGECQGLTSAGCTRFKISLAQEEAQQEVVHLSILMGVMLLLMADLAGWVTKLEDAAAWFATLALGDSMTVVGAIFFGTLSALAAGAAILLAGSMST